MLKQLESFVNNGKNYSLHLVTDNDLVSSKLEKELDGLIERQYALGLWLSKPGDKYFDVKPRVMRGMKIILLENDSSQMVGYTYWSPRFCSESRSYNCYVIPSLRGLVLGKFLGEAKRKYLVGNSK